LDKASGGAQDAASKHDTSKLDTSQAHPSSSSLLNTPKSSKKRDRAAVEGDKADHALTLPAAGGGGGNFVMVDKYGPVLSAEYLTGFNLLVVERYAASLFASYSLLVALPRWVHET